MAGPSGTHSYYPKVVPHSHTMFGSTCIVPWWRRASRRGELSSVAVGEGSGLQQTIGALTSDCTRPSSNSNTPLSYHAVYPAYECLKILYMSVKGEIDELEGDVFDTSPTTDSPANSSDTDVPVSTVAAAKKPRLFPPESRAILQSAHLCDGRAVLIQSDSRRISGRWSDETSTRTTTGNSTENWTLAAADSLVVHPQTHQSPSHDHAESTPPFYATDSAAACQPGCEWEQYSPNRKSVCASPRGGLSMSISYLCRLC